MLSDQLVNHILSSVSRRCRCRMGRAKRNPSSGRAGVVMGFGYRLYPSYAGSCEASFNRILKLLRRKSMYIFISWAILLLLSFSGAIIFWIIGNLELTLISLMVSFILSGITFTEWLDEPEERLLRKFRSPDTNVCRKIVRRVWIRARHEKCRIRVCHPTSMVGWHPCSTVWMGKKR
jgi:hypothetical protein